MNNVETIKATEWDESLTAIQIAVISGSWDHPKIKPYLMIKNEITAGYDNKVLLRGTRLILPTSLQKHGIQIAYEGHHRETVWFPDTDKQS